MTVVSGFGLGVSGSTYRHARSTGKYSMPLYSAKRGLLGSNTMMAGKRWCESRSVNRPSPMLPGATVAARVSTSLSLKVTTAMAAVTWTWNESPTTVTRRWCGSTSGSSMRTSLSAARPTVSAVLSRKSTRRMAAR